MAIGLATGIMAGKTLIDTIRGGIKSRQASKINPELNIDTTLLERELSDIKRRRRLVETGSGASAQLGRDMIGRTTAQTQQNLLKMARTPQEAAQLISQSARVAGDSTNKMLSGLREEAGLYTNLAAKFVGEIQKARTTEARGRFDVDMWRKIQKMREGAELTTGANRNMGALLGFLATGQEDPLGSLFKKRIQSTSGVDSSDIDKDKPYW